MRNALLLSVGLMALIGCKKEVASTPPPTSSPTTEEVAAKERRKQEQLYSEAEEESARQIEQLILKELVNNDNLWTVNVVDGYGRGRGYVQFKNAVPTDNGRSSINDVEKNKGMQFKFSTAFKAKAQRRYVYEGDSVSKGHWTEWSEKDLSFTVETSYTKGKWDRDTTERKWETEGTWPYDDSILHLKGPKPLMSPD